MNDHISKIVKFFNDYCKNLIENNILSDIKIENINVDYMSKSKKGHVSSNFLLIVKKKIINKDFDLEKNLIQKINKIKFIDKIIISKNGFINIFINSDFLVNSLFNIIREKNNFGKIYYGQNKKINIEYVSANPTGPIHIAHIRGAVIGDVLAKLFKKIGYNVTKEYYVNDAGSQIEILGKSLYKRYCQLLNISVDLETNDYPGEYLIDIAKKILSEDNDKWLTQDESKRKKYFQTYAVYSLINIIKKDLSLINIEFDNFIYESDIVEKKLIDALFKILNEKKLIYKGKLDKPKGDDSKNWEERDQLLFKSSSLFDDNDRALQNSKGLWTYFANDSAYHYDKYLRNFDKLINIWGADHIGYINRMKSIVFAITNDQNYFEVITCQIVRLIKNNQILKMSKREGNFISLNDVFQSVGKDPLRYFMVSTRSETPMDFDMSKVIEKNKDNPVFYCQYAYARASSVINKAKKLNIYNLENNFDKNLYKYITESEVEIILKLISYPYLLLQATLRREPHRIVNYLEDISSSFHSFWNMGKDNESLRFLDETNSIKMHVRMIWLESFRIVLKNALDDIGINAPETM